MGEMTLDLPGAQMIRLFEEMRGLGERLDRLEGALDKLATKEQVGLVWRSLELKLELELDRDRDLVAELKRSVAALDARVKAIEERQR